MKCKKQLSAFASFREIMKTFSALYSHTEFIHAQNTEVTFCILVLLSVSQVSCNVQSFKRAFSTALITCLNGRIQLFSC